MKKQSIIQIYIFLFLIFIVISFIRLKTARVEVELTENLSVEFLDKKKISDFITSINGKLLDDREIDSTKLGIQEITFRFKNDQGIRIKYSFNINIVDTTKPYIGVSGTYSVKLGSSNTLLEDIMCADNIDENPKCYIEGSYDLNTVGTYPLKFIAEDASGNINTRKFNLKVYKPTPSNKKPTTPNYINIEEIIKQYKTPDTKIGIDISKWQETIDFTKVKNSGIEFVMIKIGSSSGKNRTIIMDPKFKENIENAGNVGLPIGIYFYSYANNIEQAKKEAEWVVKELKEYKVNLPIVFDWEEWNNFNKYNFSLYELSKTAESFLKIIESSGYEGMLYSSKYYLENIWFQTNYKIWLAHYTKKTNYKGKYYMWQLTNNGKVDGIKTAVDINILYP